MLGPGDGARRRHVQAAEQFKAFLESVVWQSQDLSPGLAGTPQARILREVDLHA